ncbi:MAG: hypothetical protein ACP5HM_10795 [Anaerolineae bacterium]
MRLLGWLPEWLSTWFKIYVLPLVQVEARQILLFALNGAADTLLFLGLPVLVGVVSVQAWNTRFTLTPAAQRQVEKWAGIAYLIAYQEDVPPPVPLVLWYKEGGLREENPPNCEGIMGFYTAVRSGEMPCFPTGPISPEEVVYQLRLGAQTFKRYCPEVEFTTQDPALLKRCYLYYNAGPGSRADPDRSAYVMNGYDVHHQNMIHTDISGRATRLQILGAWPVHLAIQTQMAQPALEETPLLFQAPVQLAQEGVDRLWAYARDVETPSSETPFIPCQEPRPGPCFVSPEEREEEGGALYPRLSPVLTPVFVGRDVTCDDLLPGVDLVTEGRALIIAPMDGVLTRYATIQGFLAVQIENESWSLWLTGLRSYLRPPGEVKAGTPIGVIGGQGSSAPALHYAVYDKRAGGYVDPLSYVPASMCFVTD